MSGPIRPSGRAVRHRSDDLAILLREPLVALEAQLAGRLREAGHGAVRPVHAGALRLLDAGGTRVGVLAGRAGITKQAMGELVAHLERHGYVTRVADPADGRATLVVATDRGRAVSAVAADVVAEVEERLRARMGAPRVRRLRGLLEELADAVAPEPR